MDLTLETLQYDELQEVAALIQKGELPTTEQINALQARFAEDYAVSKEEAEILFWMKAEQPDIIGVPGFVDFFINTITSFILFTGATPGEVDTIEFTWLKDHIDADYKFDELEEALLLAIASRTNKFPPAFMQLMTHYEEMNGGEDTFLGQLRSFAEAMDGDEL